MKKHASGLRALLFLAALMAGGSWVFAGFEGAEGNTPLAENLPGASQHVGTITSQTSGSLILLESNAATHLPPGASATLLTSNGPGADPSYQALPASSLPGASQFVGTITGQADGSLVILNGASATALGAGASGDVLTSNGAGSSPTYQTPATGGNETLAQTLALGATSGANDITMSTTQALVFADTNVLIGGGLTAGADGQVVLIGQGAINQNVGSGTAEENVVIGPGAKVDVNAALNTDNDVVIGHDAACEGILSVVVGNTASILGEVANSIAIGNFARCPSSSSVSIGPSAFCSASNSVVIGQSAIINPAGAFQSVAIGKSASVSGSVAVAVGDQATVTADRGLALGASTTVGHSGSIALGAGSATTATAQIAVGGTAGSSAGFTDSYWGRGVTNAAPQDFSMNTTGASGTDVTGSNFTLRPGPSTGSAAVRALVFEAGTVGTTGATPHSQFARLTLSSGGAELGTDNGASFNIRSASEDLSALSGASVSTTSLVPAGARLRFVVARVTVLVTGATSWDMGDGSDVDRFGAALALAADTTVDETGATADPGGWSATAQDVTVTANGSNFTGGTIRVTALYTEATAPQ